MGSRNWPILRNHQDHIPRPSLNSNADHFRQNLGPLQDYCSLQLHNFIKDPALDVPRGLVSSCSAIRVQPAPNVFQGNRPLYCAPPKHLSLPQYSSRSLLNFGCVPTTYDPFVSLSTSSAHSPLPFALFHIRPNFWSIQHLIIMASHEMRDDFFVECDDQNYESRQAEMRERAKAFARERQHSIAEELSRQVQDQYQDDILDTMEDMEMRTLPDVNSIDIQTEIQWFMRPFLLEFLIEAHAAFRLLPETLYLAVNLLDRYCSKRVVYKRHYQLVGCAALLIAAKYGDKKDHVPRIVELKSMCCGLYEDEMFTQMEWHVLQTLDWLVGHPTVDSFLQIILTEEPYDAEVEHMTWYICEMSLFHRDFVSILPSVLARSALALARYILSRPLSNPAEWSGRYDYDVLLRLSEVVYQPSPVLSKKYGTQHLSYVSRTLDAFLEGQRQAELARQQQEQALQVQPPIPVPGIDGPSLVPMDTNLMPHTPQKGLYAINVHNGLVTPPITPENDLAYAAMCGKAGHLPPCPATPTPPCSGAHHAQNLQYRYGYSQPQPTHAQYYIQ